MNQSLPVSRRSFLNAVPMAALGGAACARAGANRPNVLLIMADDLGVECLGCYGGTSYRTPNLDRMAQQGVRFTHAYAQPLCTPTRMQLMTGQYNFRNWRAFGILDPEERTFGHMMQAASYRTAIAGKWQLYSYDGPGSTRRGIGKPPAKAGFDEYSLWHYGHTETKGSRYADPVIEENGKALEAKGRYGDDLFSEYLLKFMERDRSRPFFAYYPMALTHGPFNSTPKSADWAAGDRLKRDPAYFRDMVEYMDDVMGRMLARLDKAGLSSNTLVLFYADNGTDRALKSKMGDRVVPGGKGYTIDTGIHVPLLAFWKGTTPAGAVYNDLVDSTDFVPTIAEATGAKWFDGVPMDGRSFLPRLRGQKGNPREWLFSHYDPHPGCKVNFPATRFAWDHEWKLYMDGRLHRWTADLEEKQPIPAGQGGPEAAAARAKLQAALDQMAKVQPPKFNEYSAYGEA